MVLQTITSAKKLQTNLYATHHLEIHITHELRLPDTKLMLPEVSGARSQSFHTRQNPTSCKRILFCKHQESAAVQDQPLPSSANYLVTAHRNRNPSQTKTEAL